MPRISMTPPRPISQARRLRLGCASLLVLLSLSSCSRLMGRRDRDPTERKRKKPEEHNPRNAQGGPLSLEEISKTLQLSLTQKETLDKHGFVVTLARDKFGQVPSTIYDQLYQQDLPVLITSDSILYAFHRRYQIFLPWLERSHLMGMLRKVLKGTHKTLAKKLRTKSWTPQDKQLPEELDLYLTVALRLLGEQSSLALATSSKERLGDILKNVAWESPAPLEIFGQLDRNFDFSQFKARGHYQNSEALSRYFQAMMWLGRARIELTQVDADSTSLHESGFEAASTLSWLVKESGTLPTYQALLEILHELVGPDDDDSVERMLDWMKGTRTSSLAQALKTPSAQKLNWIQAQAKSRIGSHVRTNSSFTADPPKPRAFLFLGQRYTLDSEVLDKLVFDRLRDPQNPKEPILRTLPKSLDVMAALGNPRAKVHLASEFARYPYESALDAQRDRLSSLPLQTWTENVHSAWLAAIASLHQRPEDPRLAPVFRSEGWKDKTLQTQLASWAELRHDHILYAKQPTTAMAGCEFPDAYVEPVPHFFRKMKLLVSKLHAIVDALEKHQIVVSAQVHEQLGFFSWVMDRLATIAQKELQHQPLSAEEKLFLKQTVEYETVGYGEERWDGWFPKLLSVKPRVRYKPTVADIHTDPPSDLNGNETRILHVATGMFELAVVVVDCKDRGKCVYLGPVSSFYEFISPERWDDAGWAHQNPLEQDKHRPEWVKSFRAPG